jgi:hypothetical protein
MKVPTTGTSVFVPTSTATAGSPGATATTNFPVDLSIYALRNLAGLNSIFFDRLRRTSSTSSVSLVSSGTAAEASSASNGIGIQSNTTVTENWTGGTGYNNILWNFRRAPGFFDQVCYTGDGVTNTHPHNLGVIPELRIVKARSGASGWATYTTYAGGQELTLNSDAAGYTYGSAGDTSTVFVRPLNNTSVTYVAYLFASCPGVSKVGSYTGNGSSQTINCGFTGGARFVLIKRTNASGDWYVWDTARGIVAGNDPHLSLNTTAAEVTSNDTIDTDSTGFVVNQVAATNVNVNAATYIFLAIA